MERSPRHEENLFSFPASIHTKDVAGLAQSVELLTGDGEVEESIPATESKLTFFKKNEKLTARLLRGSDDHVKRQSCLQ